MNLEKDCNIDWERLYFNELLINISWKELWMKACKTFIYDHEKFFGIKVSNISN